MDRPDFIFGFFGVPPTRPKKAALLSGRRFKSSLRSGLSAVPLTRWRMAKRSRSNKSFQ